MEDLINSLFVQLEELILNRTTDRSVATIVNSTKIITLAETVLFISDKYIKDSAFASTEMQSRLYLALSLFDRGQAYFILGNIEKLDRKSAYTLALDDFNRAAKIDEDWETHTKVSPSILEAINNELSS